MSGLASHQRYSFQEYLELEEASTVKHEYFLGEMYAMAGGTAAHAALASALASSLVPQLRGTGCRLFSSDLRVRIQATGLATYPDVSVACGHEVYDRQSETTLVNPRGLIEVLSTSTEEYDRNEKWAHYQKIPSLRAYALVAQDKRRIEVFSRNTAEGSWRHHALESGEIAFLSCSLDIDQIYADAGL